MSEEIETSKRKSFFNDEAEEEEKPTKKIRKVEQGEEGEDADEDAGSEDGEDREDGDDGEDNYEEDDFLIADDELHPDEDSDKFEENDSAEEDEDNGRKRRLKKQKRSFHLDEDDLLLIQDQKADHKKVDSDNESDDAIRPEKQPDADNDKSFVDKDVIEAEVVEPEDVGSDDDGLGDFIADRKKQTQSAKQRTFKKNKDGPTFDQLEDARAIFGDGYDEQDFDDDNNDQDLEKVGGLRGAKEGSKSGTRGANKAQYEYIQLVQTFCLDEDEEIRRTDLPERFQLMTKEYAELRPPTSPSAPSTAPTTTYMDVEDVPPVSKPTASFIRPFTDLERSLEAIWIASQLILEYEKEEYSVHKQQNQSIPSNTTVSNERIFQYPKVSYIAGAGYPPILPSNPDFHKSEQEQELIDCVKQVLIYLQIDFLEIPYIYLYKQDYLLPYMTRNTLWKIYFYHEEYCLLLLNKEKTIGNMKQVSSLIHHYAQLALTWKGQAIEIPLSCQEFTFHAGVLVSQPSDLPEHEKKYLQNGLVTWWKQFPLDAYVRILEDSTDEMLIHDIIAYLRLLIWGHKVPTAFVTTTTVDDVEKELMDKEEEVEEEGGEVEEEEEEDEEDDEDDEFFRTMNMSDEDEDDYHKKENKDKKKKMKKTKKSSQTKATNATTTANTTGTNGYAPIQRRQTKLNKYSKYKNHPYLRTFVNLLVHPAYELAAAITSSQELTSPMTIENICNPEELSKQFTTLCHFKSPAELFYHASLIIATEVSYEPMIRKYARDIFRSRGTISTRPTKRGLQMINPMNEYFGIHYLDQKPIKEFYENESSLLMFMAIIDAEQKGLLTMTIYPPQKLENNEYVTDKATFLFSGLKLMSKFLPPQTQPLPPIENAWKDAWDLARLNALQITVEKHIIPLIEQDIRQELIRLGKEAIISAMTKSFEAKLTPGPYRIPQQDQRQAIADRLLSCPLGTVYENIVGIYLSPEEGVYGHMVQILTDGMIGATMVIAKQGKDQIRDKLKTFLYDTRPGLIVINSSGGFHTKELVTMLEKVIKNEINATLELDYNLQKAKREQQRAMLHGDRQRILKARGTKGKAKGRRRGGNGDSDDEDDYDEEEEDEVVPSEDDNDNDDDDDDDEPFHEFKPEVLVIEDDLANIIKVSPMAKAMFPELAIDSIAAASLARMTQEPLTEYATLFKTVDSTFLFGYEILYLQLHPLQKMITSHKRKVIKWLESRMVNRISDIGVSINQAMKYPHYGQLIAFLPGFGPRKAELLKHQIQSLDSVSIPNRKYLFTSKLLPPILYNNAIGFMKILAPGVTNNLIRHIDGIPTNAPVNLDLLFDHEKLSPLDITRIHPEYYNIHDYAPKICADALEKECNPSHMIDIVKQLMKSVRKELEKRIKRYPAWLDLWEYNNIIPQGLLDVDDEDDTNNNGNEAVVRPRYTIELYDSLAQLMLLEYAKDLALQGHGKRRLCMELIKHELRYPFLDLRAPISTIFNTPRFYDLLNGVNDTSLYVGLTLGVTVIEIVDQSFINPGNDSVVRRQKALVKTDNNLRGYIPAYEVLDQRIDDLSTFRLSDYLSPGQQVFAVVVGVDKVRHLIELSIKPSKLAYDETWWIAHRRDEPAMMKWYQTIRQIANPATIFDDHFLEEDALTAYSKEHTPLNIPAMSLTNGTNGINGNARNATNNMSMNMTKKGIISRAVYHPLFANVDFKEAEDRLTAESRRAGAVLIRPSSKGSNYLTITWAFQSGWYKHISIKEGGKKLGDIGLGKELYIQENDLEDYAFADLDEIYAMYIEPMNEHVKAMTDNKSFRSGTPEQVEEEMKKEIAENHHRIPYFIRLEPNKPGYFVLTWLNPQSLSVKTLRIEVRPKGFKIGTEYFSVPSALIAWFKKINERSVNAQGGGGATGRGGAHGSRTPGYAGQGQAVTVDPYASSRPSAGAYTPGRRY